MKFSSREAGLPPRAGEFSVGVGDGGNEKVSYVMKYTDLGKS